MMFRGQLLMTDSSQRQEVWITIKDGLLILNTGESYSVGKIKVDTRTGANAPFFIQLPDGKRIIVVENVEEFNRVFYSNLPVYKRDWLHKLETWKKSLIVSLIVLVSATVFWVTIGSDMVARWLANQIPEKLEYEIGKNIVSTLEGIGMTITEPVDDREKKLEEIFNLLVENSDIENIQFQLYIINNFGGENALAIPGGHILFTSDMVNRYLSEDWEEDAIAGVVGHEIGHIIHKHSLKILIKSALISSIFTILTGDVSVVSFAMAQQILVLSYQRKQEEEADEYAIKLLLKSGMNPEPFINLMLDLERRYKTDVIPEFVKTHPHTSERVKKMRSLLRQLTNDTSAGF